MLSVCDSFTFLIIDTIVFGLCFIEIHAVPSWLNQNAKIGHEVNGLISFWMLLFFGNFLHLISVGYLSIAMQNITSAVFGNLSWLPGYYFTEYFKLLLHHFQCFEVDWFLNV